MLRLAVLLALTLLPSLASADACPLAVGKPRGWFDPWRTETRLTGFVWSNTGEPILGIERVWEEKKVLTFFGWKTVEQKVCHQLFWTSLDSSARENLGPVTEGEADLYQAFSYPSAGYVLMQVHAQAGWQTQQVTVAKGAANNGKRTTLLTIDGSCDSVQALPSPGGDSIALVHTRWKDCKNAQAGSASTVTLFGQRSVGTLDFAGSYVLSAWTPANELVVTDYTSAYSITTAGAVTSVSVPTCMTTPTTSSDVDAQGRLLGINEGQAHVVGTDLSRAFGCPAP
jgi:hypothetical protein